MRKVAGDNNYDVLIVGAGFSGVYQLQRLRQMGFKVRLYEAGGGLGGIWHWNCYPGARVDSHCSIYQFSAPELWRDWEWSEKYPGFEEMRAYFDHVDRVWDISKDVSFNTRVTAAEFDDESRQWLVYTDQGNETRAHYVVFCTGFGSKPYVPSIDGLDDFRGVWHHTALWPQQGLSLEGKRVGVVGTGASGIQVAQEAAKVASQLTVFQRTPNMFLPMCQTHLSHEDNEHMKQDIETTFAKRKYTFGGFDFDFIPKKALSVGEGERLAVYEQLWADGGFPYWLGTYEDILFDEAANRTAYDFWRDKIREQIGAPDLAEVLAPMEPLHPFGAKRPSLVQNYFEIFNQPNVDLIDVRRTPIDRVNAAGVVIGDTTFRLDVLVLATGFDAVTGGLTSIDIRGTDGRTIGETWADGVRTHLGVATAGFPNMFFAYGPQAPTGFLNGPSSAEYQGECLLACLAYMREQGKSRIEATSEAEDAWRALNIELVDQTLFPQADSWYMGANVPGKRREILNYPGGLPDYLQRFETSARRGYEGFIIE